MNKKLYIKPTLMARQSSLANMILVLSNEVEVTGAGQSGEGLTTMGIDLQHIGYDNSGLSNDDAAGSKFRSDNGPWESIW